MKKKKEKKKKKKAKKGVKTPSEAHAITGQHLA